MLHSSLAALDAPDTRYEAAVCEKRASPDNSYGWAVLYLVREHQSVEGTAAGEIHV